MVTDKWEFVYPVGYIGKLNFDPHNPEMKMQWFNFGIVLSVHLKCPKVMIWNPYTQWSQNYMPIQVNTHLFLLKMSVAAVTLTEVKLIFKRSIYTHDKNFQTQIWHFVPLWKVSNAKTFFDRGDLENKAKVKLMTCNKSSFHCASWVWI